MKTRNCNRHTCILNQCSNVDQKPDIYKDMHGHYADAYSNNLLLCLLSYEYKNKAIGMAPVYCNSLVFRFRQMNLL